MRKEAMRIERRGQAGESGLLEAIRPDGDTLTALQEVVVELEGFKAHVDSSVARDHTI